LPKRSLSKFFDDEQRVVVGLFFAAFLLIGLGIYKDYGLSWDENRNHANGKKSFNYVFKGDRSLLTYSDRYYGVAFELPLFMIEKILKLETSRQVFLMRHLATFLMFFLGVVFFYRLNKDHFRSWKIGLLGSLLLILSPRLFAESFYNSKDLVFLSLFIISIYTLIQFLEKASLFRAAVHAFVCALLIDVRVLGILVPGLTLVFFVAATIFTNRSPARTLKKGIPALFLFLALTICLMILFWPILWNDPVAQFIRAWRKMSRYPWSRAVLYMGRYLFPENLPWHYIPVWMLITTPLLYTATFVAGLVRSIAEIFRRPVSRFRDSQKRDILLFLAWFFGPLLAVIIFKPVVYDSWRHLYFIYPAFLILSLKGMLILHASLKSIRRAGKVLAPLFVLIIFFGLARTAAFLIINHPHQNVYFNVLAGKNVQADWDLDYWGLSYRQALEYILKHDPDQRINICVQNAPGELNSFILKDEDGKRLNYVTDLGQAKYFLSDYRWQKEGYSYPQEFYSITVGRAKIMVVFKLR
jgi:hypothetical protein